MRSRRLVFCGADAWEVRQGKEKLHFGNQLRQNDDRNPQPRHDGAGPHEPIGGRHGYEPRGRQGSRRHRAGAAPNRQRSGVGLESRDLVIGIAASGRTPYVLGALAYAKEVGCRTAAVSCNAGSEIGKAAGLAVEVVVGPEVLTGSTRLKAGTAQKLVLNMISTASMVGVGKAYQNLMVDVMQTNEKLHRRAEKIVMEATGVDQAAAREKITAAGGSVKTAITMILANCGAEEAAARLKKARGHVREAIQ